MIARSICCGVRGGSTEMVGTSTPHGAVARQLLGERAGLLLACAARGRASRTAAWSRTTTACRAVPTVSPTTTRPGPACLAAFTAAATSPRVEVIVRCSTVVPPRVIAIGVPVARPAATSARGDLDRAVGAVEHHERDARVGVQRPVDTRVVGVDDAHLARLAAEQPDAGVRRDAGERRDAGRDVERAPWPWRAPRPRSAARRRAAGRRRTGARRDWPALAASPTILARAACDERQAVLVEGGSHLGLRRRRTPRARSTTSTSATTTSASRSSVAARSVSRSGSPGPAATNATVPSGFLRARDGAGAHVRFPSRDGRPGAPAARRSRGELAPDGLRVAGRAGDRRPHLGEAVDR